MLAALKQIPLWLTLFILIPRGTTMWFALQDPTYVVSADSRGYLQLAHQLTTTQSFTSEFNGQRMPEVSRVPGYALFLALIGVTSEERYAVAVVAQTGLALLTLFAFFGLLRVRGSQSAAVLATFFLAADLTLLMHTPLIMTETLFTSVQTLWIFLTWDALKSPQAFPKSIGSGLLCGVLTLIKPIQMFFAPLLGLLLARKRWSSGVIALAFAALLPLVWVARNVNQMGFAGLTTQGGVDLLRYPAAAALARDSGQSWSATDTKLRRQLDQSHPNGFSTPLERSRAYQAQAKQIIREHSGSFVIWNLLGAARILGGTGLEMPLQLFARKTMVSSQDNASVQGEGTRQLVRKHPLLMAVLVIYVIFLLALYGGFCKGLLVLCAEDQKTFAIFLGIAVLYYLALASHQGYYRFRIPLMPLLAIGAGIGWQRARHLHGS